MPGLRTPPLDLFAEHVVELGELTRPVHHGTNDCLSLGGIERHVNRSRGKRSLHLVRNGRIAASPQSADQLGNVVGVNGHAGHIDVAPQRHARWVSRSSNAQTWASASPCHLSARGAWRPARHGAATPVVEAPVRHYRVVFIPDSRERQYARSGRTTGGRRRARSRTTRRARATTAPRSRRDAATANARRRGAVPAQGAMLSARGINRRSHPFSNLAQPVLFSSTTAPTAGQHSSCPHGTRGSIGIGERHRSASGAGMAPARRR